MLVLPFTMVETFPFLSSKWGSGFGAMVAPTSDEVSEYAQFLEEQPAGQTLVSRFNSIASIVMGRAPRIYEQSYDSAARSLFFLRERERERNC